MLKVDKKIPCPLCDQPHSDFYWQDKRREYRQCPRCKLVFVPQKYWLSEHEEKQRYDLHRNLDSDMGYQRFLARIIEPLCKQLQPKQKKGLEFGSGSGPVLFAMLKQQGFEMEHYDKFYQADKRVLQQQYDFITATEVFEHLQNPAQTIKMLWSLLKEQGILAIMTKQVIDRQAFSRWHYKNDETHIVFFSRNSFDFLAQKLNAEVYYYQNDIVLLRKN